MQNNGLTFFISGSSGLGKSRFAKDLAKLTSLTGQYPIQFILLQRQDGKTYDFIDSEYRHKVTIFDDIDATSFGFQEFLNVTRTTSQDFFWYTNRHGISLYEIITKKHQD